MQHPPKHSFLPIDKTRKIVFGIFLCLLGSIVLSKEIVQTPVSACHITARSGYFLMSPQCLLSGTLPPLSLQKSVDIVWNEVQGFSKKYQPYATNFSYEGSTPLFTKQYPSLIPQTAKEIQDLVTAQQNHQLLHISLQQLAHYYLRQYTWYVVDKNIAQMKPCTKTNYLLAFHQLDHELLDPGASRNLNATMQQAQGYCKGLSGGEHMFYGGVCGSTSQVFRIALLDPDIAVLQRSPHNERFTVYYGPVVQGDDAAIIDMRKQLEIQNISEFPLYFRTWQHGDTTSLVAISPSISSRYVRIHKERLGELSIRVDKNIYKKNIPISMGYQSGSFNISGTLQRKDTLLDTITFPSVYMDKNYEDR